MTSTTLTVLLGLATVVLGAVFASYTARVCRGAHDVARSMGESGTDIRQIVRRTKLPQDVVSMLLASPAASRQNVPASAGTARQVAARPARSPAASQPRSLRRATTAKGTVPARRATDALRGTDVAVA
jgi:hypothetical protein